MASVWIWTLGSVVIVSLISLIGIAALAMRRSLLHRILLLLVSFSAGALLGDAFIHLLGEHIEEFGFEPSAALLVILGMIIFFVLEKFVHWHHCHSLEYHHADEAHKGHHARPHIAAFGITNLVGDGLHNFIDGLVIAASYLVSVPVGIATTIAVVLHEIPQEIGDFGVLIHAGLDRFKALLLNFATALTAVLGAILGLILAGSFEAFTKLVIPVTAGSFIYIATADLIPELHKEVDAKKSFLQLLGVLAGIGMMLALLLLE